MSRYFSKGLIAAMEEGDLDDIASGDGSDYNESMSTLNDVSEEIAEESMAIESMSLAIEEAVEDAGQIEEVVDTVADVSESGNDEGLTEGEAVLAEEAFRQAFRRLGGSASQSVMPSLESFRSSNSRKAATNIALEGVVEKLKSIWRAIIEAIKKLYNKVRKFIAKLFDGNKALLESSKSLKERVNKIKSSRTSEDTFENSGLAKAFPDSKTIDKDTVFKYLDNHRTYVGKIKAVKTIMNGLEEMTKDTNTAQNTLIKNPIQSSIINPWVNNMFNLPNNSIKEIDTEQEATSELPLTGGKVVEVTTQTKTEDDVFSFSLSYKFIEKSDLNEASDQKVEVGSRGDMLSVCDAVIKFTNDNKTSLKELEQQEKDGLKLLDGIAKTLERVMKSPEIDSNKSKAKTNERILRRTVPIILNKSITYSSALNSLNIKCGKSALRWVEASLSKYKN